MWKFKKYLVNNSQCKDSLNKTILDEEQEDED